MRLGVEVVAKWRHKDNNNINNNSNNNNSAGQTTGVVLAPM